MSFLRKTAPAPEIPHAEDAASPERTCLNCGAPLRARYCPECGQERSDRVLPIWKLVSDFLDDAFSWDSKLFRTMGRLLFVPGLLTEEYNLGRRARYLSPFRLYLFTSAAMFFLMSRQVTSLPVPPPAAPLAQTAVIAPKTLEETMIVANGKPVKTPAQYEAAQSALPPEARDSTLKRYVTLKALKLRHIRLSDLEHRMATGMVQNAPKGMFILLPAFALLLKMLYARRGRLYIEHLVFALHNHAFVFTLVGLELAWRMYGRGPKLEVAPYVSGASILYLLLAMKRVYRQGWLKTSLKFGMLATAYCFLFALTIAGVAVLAFLNA